MSSYRKVLIEDFVKTGRKSFSRVLRLIKISAIVSTLLIFHLAIAAVNARSCSKPNIYAVENDLNAIIDGLQAKYSRMRGLSANFVQMYQASDGRSITESGTLLLKRPGKARWEYKSPEQKLFISDGRTLYFYVAGERQASKTSVKKSADPQIPFLFLLGRGNLRRDFTRIELLSDGRAAEAGNRVLRLVPKNAPEEFSKLLVEVNPNTFEVRRMVIFERNGAKMDFRLSNVKENYVAPDTQFNFTTPPGVTVQER